MEHKEIVIESLLDLKQKAADTAKNLVNGISVTNFSELDRILKPFSDVEKQIDKSIKFLQSSGPIAKVSELRK